MASSSRGAQQDSFIDEDDLTCPLCVEEFDLSDRNFRPCPCGYQVCQFCFNNIKTNMNGLCPACRRPYDEKTIEWKVVTQEEIAKFKADVQKNAKKKAEQRQKEAQKREVENLNRKHLAGLRVVQKNLVYVVGLHQNVPEHELLQTLRGDQYFGQYGKIIKIVVSKAKGGDAHGNSSLGVYVTFARKEDAAQCITAVNGSTNGDRVLRAQLGTTKYCSAYLRNETCTNKQCMFLHEPGDNDDSYSRQDLSSINSVGTQRPLPETATSSRRTTQGQAPLQQAQPVAAASQPMARDLSKDDSESGDGSALPSTAHWGSRGAQPRSRRGSMSTSGATSSPAISTAMPAPTEGDEHSSKQDIPRINEISNQEALPPPPSTSESLSPTLLTKLIKSLAALSTSGNVPLNFGPEDLEIISSFPPLFDNDGGLKRKAIREQEEARLHNEQESQNDMASISDPQEEEEPESGSGQLGGEPEDREDSREGSTQPQGFHDSRRPSMQMPIQRASNDSSLFGGSLGQNYSQNLGNLSQINGRTMTPQQMLMLKSGQSQNFLDQFPPGMSSALGSSQAGLYQQQGHGRQASRYNFANDSASAKQAINTKLMAQQSSVMGTQQGNQFYSSSISGPPPGLKSTGTPPVSGGGLFGQSQFGGSLGGSSYGSASRDNQSDMLREIIRGRGGASSGGQGHDAGKREFMFPSFLHQYPSASTPAPASGPLASLYGAQPGAFHDFGSKQKKKGKKHRHANTSSSGGGGLVDLADPNILQARMPLQQQQSNSGVGQGLFGGQGQDDQGLPFDEASMSVDALVADSDADVTDSFSIRSFDVITRSSTPAAPPGLPLPHAHPSPTMREDPIAKPTTRIVPTSAPFTPSRNVSSAYIPRAATPLAHVSVPSTPSLRVATPKLPDVSVLQAKQDVKSMATTSGLSKTIAAQGQQNHTNSFLQQDDFPVLEKSKDKESSVPVGPRSMTPVSKKPQASSISETAPTLSSRVSSKRSTPGILNIGAAAVAVIRSASTTETPTKTSTTSSNFPPLPPSTPASTATQSATVRAPKTLRVIPTPKSESPTATTITPQSASSTHLPPTRQASFVSNSRIERPSTPVSEIISDNASITSNSMSRPGSPPPMRIGSAPVRSTTKSQQKKQRREAQKEKEKSELDTVVDKPETEVEIAPIMGRKKKQKKEKISSVAGGSTPAASRPQSPTVKEIIETEKPKVEDVVDINNSNQDKSSEAETIVSKAGDAKLRGKAKVETQTPQEPPPPTVENVEEPAEKPTPTPMSVLQELVASGVLPDPKDLVVFKSPVGLNQRLDYNGDLQDLDHKLIITEEDRKELLAGRPVHKVAQGLNRIMLTPNGDCVRNLTPEEEERYLDLQATIFDEFGPGTFVASRHNASNGFTLIGGRAVPNGPPAFFPPVDASGKFTPVDAVGKIQRDEALSYINQYVLPSLSTNSQLERALNANALDAEMLRPTEAQNFSGYGAAPPGDIAGATGDSQASGETVYNTNSANGILATGLQSMTEHFATGRDNGRGQPLGNVTLLSLADSESALQSAKKETEKLEKSFNQLLKKNRRLMLGAGH